MESTVVGGNLISRLDWVMLCAVQSPIAAGPQGKNSTLIPAPGGWQPALHQSGWRCSVCGEWLKPRAGCLTTLIILTSLTLVWLAVSSYRLSCPRQLPTCSRHFILFKTATMSELVQ